MKLQIHTIKPAKGSTHRRKIVGRGNASGHGNYSGHGGKGQTARSGGSRGLRLKAFKPLMQQTPKLRGFKSIATKPAEINLNTLSKHFKDGETVDLRALKEKNLVGNNTKAAKILNTGKLDKKLNVVGLKLTATAKASVETAGGSIK